MLEANLQGGGVVKSHCHACKKSATAASPSAMRADRCVKARNDATNAVCNCKEEQSGCFVSAPGSCLRVFSRGAQCHGTAMRQVMRQITFSVPHFDALDVDGKGMDMTVKEVGHWRACCPIKPNPCRSTQLSALEMFSGQNHDNTRVS